VNREWRWWFVIAVLAAACGVAVPHAQAKRDTPKTARLYIFDGGRIDGLDTKLFGFERNEVKEPNFRITSYLIVHPRGTLMWDSGGIPDSAFTADGTPAKEGVMTATRRLEPQLAAAGYAPMDITWFGLSHYHSDHTANANLFAGATWIVQKAERDAMFADKPASIMQPAQFSALKDAKTKLLDNEDFDVFGDGTVVVKTAPGHTPGHQVLFVKLARTGPVLLAGDLYHYPEERTTGKTPTFEFDADQSRVTRGRIESFVKQSGAQLWIEHDIATHAQLPFAPGFVE
jgi:glyoxylase-like metal-dependent hydrolase (beta-lactamase superfamily II)